MFWGTVPLMTAELCQWFWRCDLGSEWWTDGAYVGNGDQRAWGIEFLDW